MVVVDQDRAVSGQDAYQVADANETYVILASLKTSGMNVAGLHILPSAANAFVSVRGTIEGFGQAGATAIFSEADNAQIDIAEDADVEGLYAQIAFNARTTIVNHGTLAGNMYGCINGSGQLTLTNYGTIGGVAPIVTYDAGEKHTVLNYGTIENGGNAERTSAIAFGAGIDGVFNAGTITGNVRLGDGADSYDGRSGTIAGTVFGEDGNDALRGGAGNDVLDGGDGDDVIEGGAAADTLIGGAGIDTLSYEHSAAPVNVALGQPTRTDGDAAGDSATGFENLTGSQGNDTLTGDGKANVLDGKGGADTLTGGLGNDTYVVDDASDTVSEAASAGTDTVMASLSHRLEANVERLVLTGKAAIDGTGNGLLNVITGNAAANTLDGGLGNDILKGGSGIDTFVFSTALGPSNIDRITDLAVGRESMHLAHDVFSTLAVGALDPTHFKDITNGVKSDADDYILYNAGKGALYYDPDGYNGATKPIVFAILDTHPTNLTAGDFLVT